MNIQQRLEEVNRRLKATIPTRDWLHETDDTTVKPGQVWTVAGGCGEGTPVWHWLVLTVLEDGTFNCSPLAPHGQLAGPDDLFVPVAAGENVIVSLECECSLGLDAFSDCLGTISGGLLGYILSARTAMYAPANARNGYHWGYSYFIPAGGPSQQWHEAIAERTEELQSSVRSKAWDE